MSGANSRAELVKRLDALLVDFPANIKGALLADYTNNLGEVARRTAVQMLITGMAVELNKGVATAIGGSYPRLVPDPPVINQERLRNIHEAPISGLWTPGQ